MAAPPHPTQDGTELDYAATRPLRPFALAAGLSAGLFALSAAILYVTLRTPALAGRADPLELPSVQKLRPIPACRKFGDGCYGRSPADEPYDKELSSFRHSYLALRIVMRSSTRRTRTPTLKTYC